MKRVFVLNAQRAERARESLARLAQACQARGEAFAPLVCATWEDGVRTTRAALQAGADQVVALGGDGTVNAVVNGFFDQGRLVRPEACLGLAQLGTGADYLRGLEGAQRTRWIDTLFYSKVRTVDVGTLRLAGGAERYFVNAVTAGLTARIVDEKSRLPAWTPKSLAYAWPALRALPTARRLWKTRLVFEDGQCIERPLLCFFAAKGLYVGSGMKVGGAAAWNDGRLDLSVVSQMPRARMLSEFARLFAGGLRETDGIARRLVSSIEITPLEGEAMPLECDGEIVGEGAARIELLPRVLRVCVSP